jgi:hypothetical protein
MIVSRFRIKCSNYIPIDSPFKVGNCMGPILKLNEDMPAVKDSNSNVPERKNTPVKMSVFLIFVKYK